MRFIEIDLFGVLISPMVPMMLAAFVLNLMLRRLLYASGALRHLWHPALVHLATYLIVLSTIVLFFAARGHHG